MATPLEGKQNTGLQSPTQEASTVQPPARDFRDDLLSEAMEVKYKVEAKWVELEIGLAPPEDMGLEFEAGVRFEDEIGLREGDLAILEAQVKLVGSLPLSQFCLSYQSWFMKQHRFLTYSLGNERA